MRTADIFRDQFTESGAPASPEESRFLALFAGGERHTPDSLSEISGKPVGKVSATLLMLELSGRVLRANDGSYEAS